MYSSAQFSRSVVSDSLRPHELQHARPPCPLPTPGVHPNSFMYTYSSYDGDLSLPLGLALGSPIFPSGCEGKLGVALESLQGRRDLT